MKHGDVFWVHLPDRGEREQRGRRPAIVWQYTSAFPRLPTILIIPLSAQLDTLRFPGTVLLQPSAVSRQRAGGPFSGSRVPARRLRCTAN